ncbi:MAG: hypothetical protein HY551_07900, partial [Elusimicrobia bacterium]|nr:hypothetical protein [Elusimicrobiota bacterium]
LKKNDSHKPCEAGCSLGCVRMVSHTLGEPLKTLGASLRLAFDMRRPRGGPSRAGTPLPEPVTREIVSS